LVLLTLAACDREAEAPNSSTKTTVEEARPELPKPRLKEVKDTMTGRARQHMTLTLQTSVANTYQSRSEPETLPDKVAALLDRRAPQLIVDPCLSQAAETYAHYYPADASPTPPRAFLSFVLYASGCPDHSAGVHLFYTSENGLDGLLKHVQGIFADAGQQRAMTHIGIGRAPSHAPYRWTWAVLMTTRKFTLEGRVPRVSVPARRIQFALRLADDLVEPKLLLMPPDGEVREQPLRQDPNTPGRWWVDVTLPSAVGETWLEILACGTLGPEVVTLWPMYIGEKPPQQWQGLLPPDERHLKNDREAERLMFDLVNEDRARHQLPALTWDPALAKVARLHSADMFKNNFFAHISPRFGDLNKRLERAGYHGRIATENLARNSSIYDAEVGLMESLGHLVNILHAEVTHLGVGVVSDIASNGERHFHITQNFSRPLQPTSPKQMVGHLHTRIEALRSDNRRPPLERPAALDRIATDAVADIARRGFDREHLNRTVSNALTRAGLSARGFRLQYQTVYEPDDLQLPDSLNEQSVKAIGLGATLLASTQGPPQIATLMLILER